MEKSFWTMSFEMGKQVLDPTSCQLLHPNIYTCAQGEPFCYEQD
jgi:hypothetical protein